MIALDERLRPIDVGDWVALRALRLEALAEAPDSFTSTFQGALKESDDEWRAKAASGSYVVVEREGRFLAMARCDADPSDDSLAWLYSMYVTPNERGRGLADALIEWVAEQVHARGCSKILLHVAASATRAVALYERRGFAPTGNSLPISHDSSQRVFEYARDLS